MTTTFVPEVRRHISLAVAAEISGLSRDTLRRAIARGDLPATRPSPRRIIIKLADLEVYLSRRAA